MYSYCVQVAYMNAYIKMLGIKSMRYTNTHVISQHTNHDLKQEVSWFSCATSSFSFRPVEGIPLQL